jgi:hypothetical protein
MFKKSVSRKCGVSFRKGGEIRISRTGIHGDFFVVIPDILPNTSAKFQLVENYSPL